MNKDIKIATLIIPSNTYPAKRNSNTQKKILSLKVLIKIKLSGINREEKIN